MTPQQFVDTWKKTSLSERSACHSHFLALCELLNQPKPVDADPEGAWYTFERGVSKSDGGHGWADVWKKGHFGWEYKKKRRDLKAAYDQLLMYREDLENPPLLVVCDMDRFEIHTNFTGTIKTVYAFDGLLLSSLSDRVHSASSHVLWEIDSSRMNFVVAVAAQHEQILGTVGAAGGVSGQVV